MLTFQKNKIKQQLKKQTIIAFVTIIILSIVPIIGNAYGGINTKLNNSNYPQCWLTKEEYFYTLYVPELITWFFSMYLLYLGFKTFGYLNLNCNFCSNYNTNTEVLHL